MNKEVISVLIVDDIAFNRLIVKEVCKKTLPFNIELLEAEDWLEAIKIVTQQKIHIVIMDYQMPGVCWADAIKIMKDDWWNWIWIGYSSCNSINTRGHFKKAWADYIFQKPQWLKDLMNVISEQANNFFH